MEHVYEPFVNHLTYQQPREAPDRVACALWSKSDKCYVEVIGFLSEIGLLWLAVLFCTSLTNISRFGNCRPSAGQTPSFVPNPALPLMNGR